MKKGFFALICCFLLLYLFPSSSAAHAYILKSTPVQDSELKESPQEIRVQFTEEVDTNLSRLLLYDEHGNQLVTTQTSEEDNWLILNVPVLDNGIYKVVWQILSVDTHVTEGSFRFSVGVPLNEQRPDETRSLDDPVPESPAASGDADTGSEPSAVPIASPEPDHATQLSHDPSSAETHAPVTGSNATGAAPVITDSQNDQPAKPQQTSNPEASIEPPEPTVDPVVYNETQNSSGALPGMPVTGAVQANAAPPNVEQLAGSLNNDQLIGQKDWNLWLRIVEIFAAVCIAGYVFFRTWIFRSKDNGIAVWFSSKIERAVISVGALLFLLAGSAHVYLLTKQFSGSTIKDIISASSIGQVSWIRPLILVVLLLTAVMKESKGRTSMHFMLLGGLMLTFPLTGHAVSGHGVFMAVLSHTVHMMAAAIWFGGLLGLFSLSFVKNKDPSLVQLLNRLLIRFSAIALPMFVLVSLSGIVLTLYRLNTWSDLIKSAYGQILLWKIAIVLVTFLIAGFHRFIMIPKIKQLVQTEMNPSRLKASNLFYGIQAEMVLAVVLLILAGVLSTGSPP